MEVAERQLTTGWACRKIILCCVLGLGCFNVSRRGCATSRDADSPRSSSLFSTDTTTSPTQTTWFTRTGTWLRWRRPSTWETFRYAGSSSHTCSRWAHGHRSAQSNDRKRHRRGGSPGHPESGNGSSSRCFLHRFGAQMPKKRHFTPAQGTAPVSLLAESAKRPARWPSCGLMTKSPTLNCPRGTRPNRAGHRLRIFHRVALPDGGTG